MVTETSTARPREIGALRMKNSTAAPPQPVARICIW
jgi:hypothetical protein